MSATEVYSFKDQPVEAHYVILFSFLNLFYLLQLTSSCCIHSTGVVTQMKRSNTRIYKYSQNTQPVFINLMSKEHPHVTGEVHEHKLQAQPKTTKICKRFPRSILGAPKLPPLPFLVPLIPKIPLLPLFPNLLKPKSSLALPNLINPSPIAKLSRLMGWSQRNTQIHEKLLQMKHKGTLSSTEYIRFMNLLMRL